MRNKVVRLYKDGLDDIRQFLADKEGLTLEEKATIFSEIV